MRRGPGKVWLDIHELRNAFVGAETIHDRATSFVAERLALIAAGAGPVPMLGPPVIALHAIPVSAWEVGTIIDPRVLTNYVLFDPMPGEGPGSQETNNFDGRVSYYIGHDELVFAYLQVFRDGAIEAVTSHYLRETDPSGRHVGKVLYGGNLERYLIRSVEQMLAIEQMVFELDLPILVAVTFLGSSGWRVESGGRELDMRVPIREIRQGVLRFPELLVDDYSVVPASVLRPTIDLLWQSSGWRGSPNFDDDGRWLLEKM